MGMNARRAICLLSQMYLPSFDNEDKEALSFAISMLSDCEPKVLTLKELKEIGDDKPIYLETTLGEVYLKPAIYQPDCSDDEYACVVSAWCKSGFYAWDNYNADWRCWSNKPSDEQMEATPWQ